MAVKLIAKTATKKKVPLVQTEKDVTNNVPLTVEKMAALKGTLNLMKKTQEEFDALRKMLLSMIPDDASPVEPYEFEGTLNKVIFSKQNSVRRITNMKKLHKMVGDEVFYAICSVPLEAVDKYIAPMEQGQIIESSLSGTRTCSIKPKGKAD